MDEVVRKLRTCGVQPSAQRVAVARYALRTHDHPSADEVFERVRKTFPMISRATVYNTLNLFVEKGLLARHALSEGRVVFDCEVAPHHHFIDETNGRIHDVPWEALRVESVDRLSEFEVREYQVVLRGRRAQRGRRRPATP